MCSVIEPCICAKSTVFVIAADVTLHRKPKQIYMEPNDTSPATGSVEPTPPEPAAEQPEQALFQSDAEFNHVDDSWPACLRTPKSGFWDNLTFI